MKNIKLFAALGAAVGLTLCLMACEAEVKTEYVEKVVEKPVEKKYVAPVTFSKVTSEADDGSVTVKMDCATTGAEIYYTDDGTEPTKNSMSYNGAVTFSTDTTLKAIAVKKGMEGSPVSSAFVSITENTITIPEPEEVTVPAGTYTVKHLVKDVTGEAYSLFGSVEAGKVIEKETKIAELALKNKGLTATVLSVSSDSDDKTVTIFYERNIITYTFIADGKIKDGEENAGGEITGAFSDGRMEATVSRLFGADIDAPAFPENDDYRCTAWVTEDGNELPSLYGEEDITFRAEWRKLTKFTFKTNEGKFENDSDTIVIKGLCEESTKRPISSKVIR